MDDRPDSLANPDVIVIGAGLAGLAVAGALHNVGYRIESSRRQT